MANKKIDEKAIFNVARQISSPEARLEYLSQVCGDDNELLARLETLLQAYAEQSSFLEKPPAHGLSPTIDQPLVEKAGTVIGPYKLLQRIGEGGMGVVYMAEQTKPIARMVALKIIKPGMDTQQVVARFEAERQALAMMDHPNIAKVLDAGTTDSERPYFVMELVKGVPITNYCDDHHLTPKERLELFIQVLHAVQHAHQKGIIHRDIKPSNVLVAEYDQQAVPKVIDFGVAKATSQKLTDKTMFTQFGQLVGTLEYMSPEQAKLNQMDIDTRCDIYSLGVLLYELLTGDTPFDRQRLRSAAFEEMMRIIREEEPPVPSTRLNTSGMLASVSANRSTEPRRLSSFMRGELDWIVMRAMEKERSRRYETPNAFADDIQRFLNQEAVVARPVSTVYRMKKFAQRNWGAVIAGSIIAATLLLGFGTSTWFAIRESRAAAEADKQRILALAAKTDADRERDGAQRAASEEARQRETAQRLAVEASAARETLRETLYVAEMNLVQAAVEDKHYMRASQLLEQQHPTNGQSDLRGFEWHYWHRQLHYRQLRSVKTPQLSELVNPGFSILRAFSQDAKRLAAFLGPGEGSTPGAMVSVFDSDTGRELFAPFAPFPEQNHIQRRRLSLARLSLALSGDGTRMAVRNVAVSDESGARSLHISIHDGISGKELRRFPGGSQFLLSADGSRLAVRYEQLDSDDRSSQSLNRGQAGIQIWNTFTGELVQTLPLMPASLQSEKIVWDPAGARLLRSSVSKDGDDNSARLRQRFVLVDVMTGKDLWKREFSDIAYPLTPWSWSPDGKQIAVAEHEPPAKPKVQLWDGNTGATVAVLDRDAPAIISQGTLAFSPDGLRLAMPSLANEIYVWELPQLGTPDGDQPLHIEKPDFVLPTAQEIVALTFGADSRELTGVDAGNSITTWNVTRDESIEMGPDLAQGLLYAAVSADASKFAFFAGSFGRPDNSYVLWDLERNSEILRLASPHAHRPDFTPDGRRVAFVRATINGSGPILIHDTQTGAMLVEIPVEWIDASIPALIIDQTIRPDGNHFAAILRNKKSPETKARLNVWELATGQLMFSVVIDSEQPEGVAYSRDGASLIVGTTRPSEVVYYDATTGVRQKSVSMPPSSNPLFVDRQHQVIAATHGSDFILSEVTTGHELLRLSGYDRVRPNSYAISPDGSRLALGSSSLSGDGEITLWSMKTGRQLLSFHEDRPVDAMAFSPNGNRLLATFSTFLVRSAASPSKPIQVFDATPLVKK